MRGGTAFKVVSSDASLAGLNGAGGAQYLGNTLLIASGTLSGSFNVGPFDTGHVNHIGIQAYVTGALESHAPPTGSLQVWTSDEPSLRMATGDGQDSFGINHFSIVLDPVVTTVLTLSGSQVDSLNLANWCHKWIYLKWVHISGTGSININMIFKGPS